MHLELPKLKLHSFKDFSKHYLMIVLSILTALGLDAWIEHAHHAHAAETASRQIRAELRSNLGHLRDTIHTNQQRIASLTQLETTISHEILAGTSAKRVNQDIRARQKEFVHSMGVNFPNFSSEAWTIAVTNRSASWMDTDQLRAYAVAYADIRNASDWSNHDAVAEINAPALDALVTRISLGMDVDPVAFVSYMRNMIRVQHNEQGQLRDLQKHLTGAMAGTHHQDPND